MRIRPVTESDAAAITALWTEAYSGRGRGEGRVTPYEEWEFFDAMGRASVFVAAVGAEAVGVVAVCLPGSPARLLARGDEAELSRLAVAATARRLGVGRALAELVAGRARAASASALILWSRPHQVEAHALYESLGYRRASERDSADGEGRRLVFSLDLAPGARPGL